MEYSMSKSLFIEFYGLPGCGKSTISHTVAKLLRKKGYSVEEPSHDIDHISNILLRKIYKLLITALWLIIHNKLFREINCIVSENNYSGLSKIEQIANIIQKIRIYRRKNLSQIVLWDQGVVQAAISLSINGYVSSVDNLNRLYKLIPSNVHIMYMLIDIDKITAKKRIAHRKTNDSRVEKLQKESDKDNMLQSFIDGISNIENKFGEEKFDGKMDVETLSNQVLLKINEKYHLTIQQ